MNKSYLILTDSGGIQEEAPSLGKPVLVMRNVTERQEGVDAGTAKLVGNIGSDILRETLLLLNDKVVYDKMAHAANPYGDGTTSEKIFSILKDLD
jgi:UDP-N-acetylglucosamine 2-epimerase (non-hydrolysing)